MDAEYEIMVEEEEANVELTQDFESDEWGDTPNCHDVPKYPEVANDLKPSVGKQFQTIDDVYNFYNAYAKQCGFSIRSWTSKKMEGSDVLKRKEFVCFKQGKGKVVADVESERRRGSVKEGCNAKIAVLRTNSGAYVVTKFIEGHSHPLATPSKRHLLNSHRKVSSAQKSLTQQLGVVNIPSNQQFNFLGVQAGGFENIGCTQKDLYNHQRNMRNESKGHDGEMLSEYLKLEKQKNPSFTYKIEADHEQRIKQCFWADGTSRRAYKFYGDVVVFDTTYNTNRYGMIFAPIMGVNNHGQTIIFACAFLSDETSDSFIWLFNQFLEAMPGDAPKMIITDQDPAMTKAISQILPDTFHRYCSWHILMKFSEKLDSVKYSKHYKEFSNCIWNSESKEEFDEIWIDLVKRSGLDANNWLKSIYEIRSKWVPVYCKHVFSADMSSSQRAESSHSFFKRFVKKENSLVDFMIQFGRGLLRQRHEELLSDHKDRTERPKVKMLHDYLLQMVNIYTWEKFYELQDELWESLNYRYELINEDEKHRVYKVQRKTFQRVREVLYNKELCFASCSCKLFESSGIPCRHILGYLHKMTNFEELPERYILKRWTKTAKTGVVIDNDNGMVINDDKSYMLMRSELIQYSLDVIDKALTSQECINIYKEALASASDRMIHVVASGGPSSQCATEKMSCNNDRTYNEPKQVRAKGCGKRLRGGKEKALRKAKNSKARRCNACGQVGQSHDKRNCPTLNNQASQVNEDAMEGMSSSSKDDSNASANP